MRCSKIFKEIWKFFSKVEEQYQKYKSIVTNGKKYIQRIQFTTLLRGFAGILMLVQEETPNIKLEIIENVDVRY